MLGAHSEAPALPLVGQPGHSACAPQKSMARTLPALLREFLKTALPFVARFQFLKTHRCLF